MGQTGVDIPPKVSLLAVSFVLCDQLIQAEFRLGMVKPVPKCGVAEGPGRANTRRDGCRRGIEFCLSMKIARDELEHTFDRRYKTTEFAERTPAELMVKNGAAGREGFSVDQLELLVTN